ncbi:MAG: MBL fold metallo-hydrolase, partial [Firmicutes bacterium]|nr:MBL fold metallo-hydrolase [Bacillota bacterium]
MEIVRKVFGEYAANCYIVFDIDTRECYVIDPGYEAEKVYDVIKRRNLNVKGIILTHWHFDHTAVSDTLAKLAVTTAYVHEKDARDLKIRNYKTIKAGHVFTFGEESLEVIHTPGHSRGSITLLDRKGKNAFTGDCIFPTDTGYVTFAGGDGNRMMESMKKMDPILTDDYMIWPGHEDNVPMSYVREHNKEYN